MDNHVIFFMKVITWNISLTGPSFQAPSDWNRDLNIFEMHKIIEEEDPDIFSLQEMPSANFAKRFVNYHFVEPVYSHSGLVGVFVKKTYKIHSTTPIPPSLVLELSKEESPNFFFVGCHLLPYKQNADNRLDQMSVIFQIINQISEDYPVIIAGDMNMRENETKNMISTFDMNDAYWKSDKSKENQYTWDSRINLYHEEAFQFVCRFDRIFLKNAKVIDFKLIGNKPVSENLNHFISDHFGISAKIELS